MRAENMGYLWSLLRQTDASLDHAWFSLLLLSITVTLSLQPWVLSALYTGNVFIWDYSSGVSACIVYDMFTGFFYLSSVKCCSVIVL